MLDSSSEVNSITPFYGAKLGVIPQITTIDTHKIDGLDLKIHKMIIAKFLVLNNLDKTWFFEETFTLTDTIMEMDLKIPSLSFSNVNLQFDVREFIWKTYTAAKVMSTTR